MMCGSFIFAIPGLLSLGASRAPDLWGLIGLIPSRTPASPTAPTAPVHRRVDVHLSGFKLLVGQFLLQAKLAVGFILFWTTYVGLVMRRIRENVVRLSILLNHGHLVVWKGLEFLLLRRSFGNDYVEARGNERVFFALRVGAAYCQGEQRDGSEDF